MMRMELRKTGVDFIGDLPWGTHFCQFYQTKEDLLDILVPYFKAGLENNEFSMWVTSEPLKEEEAKEAMRGAVPHFDEYLKKGQIEIIPYTEWYLREGVFNSKRVLSSWIDKLEGALAKGYAGLRLTGNTFWLEKKDWRNFTEYEKEINNVIGKYRMIAICTYSLERCGAVELIEVVDNHQFAVIRQNHEWELLQNATRRRTEEALKDSESRYRLLAENVTDVIWAVDMNLNVTYVSPSVTAMLGYSAEEVMVQTMEKFLTPGSLELAKRALAEELALERKKQKDLSRSRTLGLEINCKDGSTLWTESTVTFVCEPDGQPTGIVGVTRDITERKKTEETLIQSERLKALGEMAGGVAHDFNNLLAIILGNAQLLDKGLKRYKEKEIRERLRVIANTAYEGGETVTRL